MGWWVWGSMMSGRVADEVLTRRSVARGLAWTAPVVAVAAAAPAMAASPTPELVVAGRVTWNRSWVSEAIDNTQGYKVFSTRSGSTYPGAGYGVVNTTPSSTLSNFTVTFYLADYGVSFGRHPSYGDAAWTTLSRDYSKATKSYRGYTFYPYTTTYTGSISARQGTTSAPPFAFTSYGGRQYTPGYFVDNSVVVGGRTIVGNYGPIPLDD